MYLYLYYATVPVYVTVPQIGDVLVRLAGFRDLGHLYLRLSHLNDN